MNCSSDGADTARLRDETGKRGSPADLRIRKATGNSSITSSALTAIGFFLKRFVTSQVLSPTSTPTFKSVGKTLYWARGSLGSPL